MKLNDLYDEFYQLVNNITTDNVEEIKNAVLNHLKEMREEYGYALPMTYTEYAGLRFEKWVVDHIDLVDYGWMKGEQREGKWRLIEWQGDRYTLRQKDGKEVITGVPYGSLTPDLKLQENHERETIIGVECKWRNDINGENAWLIETKPKDAYKKVRKWFEKYKDDFGGQSTFIVWGFGWDEERKEPDRLYLIPTHDYVHIVFGGYHQKVDNAKYTPLFARASSEEKTELFSKYLIDKSKKIDFIKYLENR